MKNLSLEAVEDIKKLERINGNIISVDVLCRNVWEHWGGYSNNVLTHNFQPKANGEEGKTIYDLWDTNYKSITIENIETGERAFIPGYNGHMKKHGYSAGMMVLGRYLINTGNRWQRLEQRVIWDTNRPVWKLVSAEQIGSREYTVAKDDFASTNGSDLKNRGQAVNISCQTNLFLSEGKNNQSKTNTHNDPYTGKDAGTIETDGHSETQKASSEQAAPVHNESDGQRIMAWARCRVCDRVNNVCRFAEFEGEGKLKSGICIECAKKQMAMEKEKKNAN